MHPGGPLFFDEAHDGAALRHGMEGIRMSLPMGFAGRSLLSLSGCSSFDVVWVYAVRRYCARVNAGLCAFLPFSFARRAR